MKKSKRLICLLLSLVMMLGLVSCGNGSDSPDKGSDQPDSGDYSQHMDISWTSVIEQDEGNDYTQDAIYKTIAEKFNVDFDIRPLTWGNWNTNVNLYINGLNLPDVTNWWFNYPDYSNFVHQELLYKLPSDWQERWPGVAEVYEKTGLKGMLEDENGDIFCLPIPMYFNNKPAEKLPSHLQIYARKDWIEQVTGEEAKTHYTFSEFLDIARKLKEANPAGVENFYPITAYTTMLVQCLVYCGYEHVSANNDIYKGDDGQYHWGPGDEQTYEILKFVQDAWKEGLIDPEFYTLNQGEDEDKMTIAHSTAMFCAGGLAANYILFTNEMLSSGLNPDESLCSFFLTDEEGRYHSAESANYFGALIFNPDMDDAKFARIMDVIQYSLSEEGQDLIHLGIEGTDFTKNADGTYEMLHEYTTSKLYPSNRFFCTFASREDDFSIINPSFLPKATDKQREQYVEKASLIDGTLAEIDWDYTFYTSDAKSRMSAIQAAYIEDYANLITMEGDLHANWEAWCADKMGIVQPVLDEMNEKFAS